MRIIAGEFRSRKLISPPEDVETRPIPDRVKESLFAILRGHVEGATVFDAFSGTGAVGLEAISRGATRAVMIERDRRMASVLQKNIDTLGVGDRAEVVIGDALGMGAISRCPRPCTIVMMDPPYALVRDPIGLRRVKGAMAELIKNLSDDGYAILRTPWPLVHELPDANAPMPEPEPRHKKGKGRWKQDDWRKGERPERPGKKSKRAGSPRADDEGEEVWRLGEDAPEELKGLGERLENEADKAASTQVKPQRVDADLKIPGAVGPETHSYSGMALHFYMAERGKR